MAASTPHFAFEAVSSSAPFSMLYGGGVMNSTRSIVLWSFPKRRQRVCFWSIKSYRTLLITPQESILMRILLRLPIYGLAPSIDRILFAWTISFSRISNGRWVTEGCFLRSLIVKLGHLLVPFCNKFAEVCEVIAGTKRLPLSTRLLSDRVSIPKYLLSRFYHWMGRYD